MSKKISYRIPVCIFIFVVGSITALLFASVLNDVLTTGSISTDLTDFSTTIAGVFGGEKPRKLYLLLEALVVLLCVVYFVCAERTYQTDTYKVTDNISVPVPSGQGQHGTAWFMSNKEKHSMYHFVEISQSNAVIKALMEQGRKRFEAVENGVPFSPEIIDTSGLSIDGGIAVSYERSKFRESVACITDDVHILIIGATRSGKTRCLVIQSISALALAGEGMVVNDPKGELYHYTHSFLESMGYTGQVVDFNNLKKSCRYNPLQMIIDAVNDDRIDDAQSYTWDFVTFLVEKNDHSEPIWTNGECSVIAAAVMCVVYDNQNHPEYQNLTNVYNFIANMCKTVNKVLPIDAYMDKLPDSHPAKKLMAIAKLAPDKMGGSFYTAALTTLRLFITNDIYNMTKESEFSLSDVGAKLKQALFFILPDQKTTYYPIVTLLVSQQYEQLVTYAKKCGNRLPHRVNYILDEFGNFAAISDFQTKMTVAGGYGVRWNLFIQDFNQLIDKYGQEVAKIIQGNCHYWIYLHSQDNSTNEEISKSMGKYTTTTYSLGGSTQKYSAPSSSTNIQLSERSLLNPDEVAKIQRPYQLVISTNAPAIMYSPDISQWAFNAMLGMGDKAHNTRLIELDENARPERGGKSTEQLLWKPWEEILRESSAQSAAVVPRRSESVLDNKPPYFRRKAKFR
ncbi:MAG: type IV secretory system conjugative DNA transfer family protein [Eubacterium sp.]|nr:type IV secretory system conjugative DNA transfer family protein [Eubacterium sp.]